VKRLLLVAVAALALAPEASAKLCVRITASPARAVVGMPVTIRVRTFEALGRVDGSFGPGEPLALQSPGPLLLLYAPGGGTRNPTLRRRADDRSIWETTVTFGRAGLWRLRLADEAPLMPGCRGRIALRVGVRR
jgi:hypothetical protein